MTCNLNLTLEKDCYQPNSSQVIVEPGVNYNITINLTSTSTSNKNVIIFVLSGIYSQAKNAIDTWADDISRDLCCNTVILTDPTWSDQWTIRNTLKTYYDSNALIGSIIVGDIPRMPCHVVQECDDPRTYGVLSPLEYFYMDFEYDFLTDSPKYPGNPLYIYKMYPFRTKICQVFCGRIIPPNGDVNYLNTYLAKNHTYRTESQHTHSGVGFFDAFSWKYIRLSKDKCFNECHEKCQTSEPQCLYDCYKSHWTRDEYLSYYSNFSECIGLPMDTTYISLDFNVNTQPETLLNLIQNKYKAIFTGSHGSPDSYGFQACYAAGGSGFPLCDRQDTNWTKVFASDMINVGGVKSLVLVSVACSQGNCAPYSGNCIGNKLLFYGDLLAFPTSNADERFGMNPMSCEDNYYRRISDGINCIGTVFINNNHYDSDAGGNVIFWGDPTIIIK